MFTYEPLFRTLDRKNMGLIEVEKGCNLSSKTTSKFRKNGVMNIDTLARVGIFLDVPIEEIVAIKRDKK